jgi:hypothetical protein
MGGKITKSAGEQAMTRAESWQPPAILGKTWEERSQKLPEYINSQGCRIIPVVKLKIIGKQP